MRLKSYTYNQGFSVEWILFCNIYVYCCLSKLAETGVRLGKKVRLNTLTTWLEKGTKGFLKLLVMLNDFLNYFSNFDYFLFEFYVVLCYEKIGDIKD